MQASYLRQLPAACERRDEGGVQLRRGASRQLRCCEGNLRSRCAALHALRTAGSPQHIGSLGDSRRWLDSGIQGFIVWAHHM